MNLKNKSKPAVYSLLAIVYVALITAYGTEPLKNLLSELPQKMATVVFYIIVMLPFVFLIGLTMRVSDNNRGEP
jgi:predicted PurR-regulated permease PerM